MATSARQIAVSGASAIVLGVLLGACSTTEVDSTERNAAGEIVAGGEIGLSLLRVGDCIPKEQLDQTTGDTSSSAPPPSFSSFQAVPCAEPHGGEVVSVDPDLFVSQPTAMPSAEVLQERAAAACPEDIEAYTGVGLDDLFAALFDEALAESGGEADQTPAPELYIPLSIVPSAGAWEQGDRSLICIAISTDATLEKVVERPGTAKMTDAEKKEEAERQAEAEAEEAEAEEEAEDS